MEFEEYRRLQVASVTGFSGTSEWEVLLTTSWPLFALLLWHSKFEGVCDSLPSTASRWLVEFGLFLAPQIVLFLYPQWAPAMVSLALLYALMAFTRRPSRSRSQAKASPLQTQRLPAITNARAAIMSMCTLGILAVDFRAFPRRFVKTETFGTSLMDVGVGTVVVSMGMMAARLWLNPKVQPITLLGRLFQAMKSTLPLLVLGALRMLLVKGVNYQEHISEYGVHWNFFITLGTLPVLVTLFFECFSLRSSFYAGLGISALYQAILSKGGLQTYLFSPDRAGLVAMNKEGIFSLAGYLGLTLMSLAVGVEMFSSAPQRTRRFYRRILILVAILSLLYFGCKQYLYILPSRRLVSTTDDDDR